MFSCSPNARVDFEVVSFSFVLHTIRDISADAEVTVTYIHTEKVAHILAAQCQEHLSSYGFTCTCMACCSPAVSNPHCAELAASQVVLFPKFHQWLENPSIPADYYIKESKHILWLIADEGLEGGQAYLHHLEHFLIAYAALRDRDKYLEVSEQVMQVRHINTWNEKPVPVGELEEDKLWKARVRKA